MSHDPRRRLNPFNIREAGQTVVLGSVCESAGVSIPSTSGKPVRPIRPLRPSWAVRLNPFNIREAGQTTESAEFDSTVTVSIPSTSGKPVRRRVPERPDRRAVSIPSTSGKPVRRYYETESAAREGLNPFNIREAGQTEAVVIFRAITGSQSLQHQGSRSDPAAMAMIRKVLSQSLQHQGSRSDFNATMTAISSSLNPFNIREAGQTQAEAIGVAEWLSQSLQHQGSRSDASTLWRTTYEYGLNPFNIREAGQTDPLTPRRPSRVSIPSTSGKPVRPAAREAADPDAGSQSLQHQGSRSDSLRARCTKSTKSLNPFNIREAGQTGTTVIPRRRRRLNPFNIREAGQTEWMLSGTAWYCLNPFNIREAGQTRSGQERGGPHGLNPFNIREAGQTAGPRGPGRIDLVSIPSTSGKPVRPGSVMWLRSSRRSQSLQHQGSRSDSFLRRIGRRFAVSIPSTSGKPVRLQAPNSSMLTSTCEGA